MRAPQKYDRLTNHVGVTPHNAAISGALEPLDKVAVELESRWGIGTLERLVTPDTAGKFASARKRLDEAIDGGDWQEVSKRASVLIRGWQALEDEAKAHGHTPGQLDAYWCVEADDGRKYVFVMHETDTHAASRKFPGHIVWSMREAVRVLGSPELSLVERAKTIWPAAVVTESRKRPGLNDDLPF